MNALFRSLTFAIAATAGIIHPGRAQVTYATFTNDADLQTKANNRTYFGVPVGDAAAAAPPAPTLPNLTLIQTFTGFSSITNMTWAVVNNNTSAGGWGSATQAATATFQAYVAAWDPVNHSISGALMPFGMSGNSQTITLDPYNSSGAVGKLSFDDVWTTITPTQTYALILTYAGGDASSFVAMDQPTGGSAAGAFFASGSAFAQTTSANLPSFAADLGRSVYAVDGPGSSYIMSVTGAPLSPVPEPRTAAAGIAALFVAGLVGRRVWQRRKAARPSIGAGLG